MKLAFPSHKKNALINALMWAKTRIKCNECYQCTVYVGYSVGYRFAQNFSDIFFFFRNEKCFHLNDVM